MAKRVGRGGARAGAGRPAFPVSEVRRNRVAFMMRDAEFEALMRVAQERNLPIGTAACEIVERALRRRPDARKRNWIGRKG